MSQKKCR